MGKVIFRIKTGELTRNLVPSPENLVNTLLFAAAV
jgi:hypothetical protein